MLIGGILTESVFLIFKPSNSRSIPDFSQMNKDGEGFNFERRSRSSDTTNDESKTVEEKTDTSSSNTTIEDVKVSKQNITKTLTSSGQIEASKTEKLSLNTSYYYSTILVEEDGVVKRGEKIIKCSNGKYLTAPYDLVITSTNLPDAKKIVNSSHSITVSASNGRFTVTVEFDNDGDIKIGMIINITV